MRTPAHQPSWATHRLRTALIDIGDFIGLLRSEGFDTEGFISFLVDRYEAQREHARDIIRRIHAGEAPIVF